MTDDLVIVGAGGFGREVADVVHAVNESARNRVWNLHGIIDDNPNSTNLDLLARRGLRHLGTLDTFVNQPPRPSYAIGIGNPAIRYRIATTLDAAGFTPATLIHPDATIGSQVHIGLGSVICAGARLTTNITLGRHVHVNLNATIGHDTTVGDFVSINPLASISGDCEIAREVTLGVGSSIINGLTVGQRAVVGGGACVIRPVAPGSTVVGVPAKTRDSQASEAPTSGENL